MDEHRDIDRQTAESRRYGVIATEVGGQELRRQMAVEFEDGIGTGNCEHRFGQQKKRPVWSLLVRDVGCEESTYARRVQ
jgi:hypothetical protein